MRPAWWNTWWFRSVWITSLLLLTWSVYQFRVRQLRRDFKKLQDVIETIPAMAWTALPDGSNEFVNRRWAEFTGLVCGEHGRFRVDGCSSPGGPSPYLEKWRASLATGEPFESEARFRNAANGEYRWLLARGVPLRDNTERSSGGMEFSLTSKIASAPKKSARGCANSRRSSLTSTG